MYTLRFDGLYRSGWLDPASHETALMCYGWLIYKHGAVIARGHGGLVRDDIASSNTAEYLALIEGLSALYDLGIIHESIQAVGDSKSVIEQMSGTAGVNSPRVKTLYRKATRLSRRFSHLNWLWEPRKRNHAADELTRRAYKQIKLGLAYGIQPGDTALDLRLFYPVMPARSHA